MSGVTVIGVPISNWSTLVEMVSGEAAVLLASNGPSNTWLKTSVRTRMR